MATAWHFQEEKNQTQKVHCFTFYPCGQAPCPWSNNLMPTVPIFFLLVFFGGLLLAVHIIAVTAVTLPRVYVIITAFLKHTGFRFLILWFGAWAQSEYRNSFGNQWRYPSPFPKYANILEKFTFLLLKIFQFSPPVWTRSWFGISVEES